jgi:hypothetical protein
MIGGKIIVIILKNQETVGGVQYKAGKQYLISPYLRPENPSHVTKVQTHSSQTFR